MKTDALVLGAGIVGVSVALHLLKRGRSVALVDRGPAGGETSFGNAGLIQREGVNPHAFPQSLTQLARYGLNRSTEMRFSWSALPRLAPALSRYWAASRPAPYRAIINDYAQFIAHSVSEHAPLIAEAGADDLIRRDGWMEIYRNPASWTAAQEAAADWARSFGLTYQALDAAGLAAAEPSLAPGRHVGAIHWTQPWTVRDPFALTQAYLRLFQRLGGTFAKGDAMSLRAEGADWQVMTEGGEIHARDAVIALGPWSGPLLARFGQRPPLFVKRGYHAHYAPGAGRATLNHPIYDEAGYMVVPMNAGLRLTTGAEFAALDAPPNDRQIRAAEPDARATYGLGARLPGPVWMGSRPCTPDMKPIIGPAGRAGLWAAAGHAHHGLTLGPATGRLLAEMMTGAETYLDPRPYRIDRFGR